MAREHIDDIEEAGRDAVAASGADQTVSAAVTTCWFPDKSYGDVTFPAGNYEALRIEIVPQKAITGGAYSIQAFVFLTRRTLSCQRKKAEAEKRADGGGVRGSDRHIRL